jgi:hypothetical protein
MLREVAGLKANVITLGPSMARTWSRVVVKMLVVPF